MPPNIYQRNAAEREIITSENHFIAGLCSINPNLRLKLWDILLYQEKSTLNLMLKYRINPNLSDNEQLFSILNFNLTPFAPPGTIIMVHDNPEKRETYAPHLSDGFYIVRAPLCYICFKCYMTITKS